jgi:chromosome segregation ATPase
MEKEQNLIVDVTALAVINNYEEKLRQIEKVLDELMERLNKKNQSIRMLQEKLRPKDYDIIILERENSHLRNMNQHYKKRLIQLEEQLSLYLKEEN